MSEIVPTKDKLQIAKVAIERYEPEYLKLLPPNYPPQRFIRAAITAVQANPVLADDPRSLAMALLEAAQYGLEPGIEAHLVPFKNKRTGRREVQLIQDYRGVLKICRRSGQIRKVEAHCVHEEDIFDYSRGTGEHDYLIHKPARGDRGEITEVYAIAKLASGESQFEVMDVPQIEAVRAQSPAHNATAWVNHWEPMAKKTVAKRLSHYLPMEVNDRAAVIRDDQRDIGIEPPPTIDIIPSGPALAALTDKLAERNGHTTTTSPPETVENGLNSAPVASETSPAPKTPRKRGRPRKRPENAPEPPPPPDNEGGISSDQFIRLGEIAEKQGMSKSEITDFKEQAIRFYDGATVGEAIKVMNLCKAGALPDRETIWKLASDARQASRNRKA